MKRNVSTQRALGAFWSSQIPSERLGQFLRVVTGHVPTAHGEASDQPTMNTVIAGKYTRAIIDTIG